MNRLNILIFSCLITFPGLGFSQSSQRVSATSMTETLQQGKLIRINSELYFEIAEGKIISWNHQPEESVYISNPLGEAQIYYPGNNTVLIRKDPAYSSKNHTLYQFINNQHYDLGLNEMGFTVISTRDEKDLVITTWQAPTHMLQQVDKIELVHQGFLPLYAAYKNTRGETILKIYYSDFNPVVHTMLPGRVTEIIFTTPTDSVIRRTTYANFRSGGDIDRKGFDFRIPADAKELK